MRETLLDFDLPGASGDGGADALTGAIEQTASGSRCDVARYFSFRLGGPWSKLNQIAGLGRIRNISAPDICIAEVVNFIGPRLLCKNLEFCTAITPRGPAEPKACSAA
jgi:hypothetical protein